jgi:hypothetical protein
MNVYVCTVCTHVYLYCIANTTLINMHELMYKASTNGVHHAYMYVCMYVCMYVYVSCYCKGFVKPEAPSYQQSRR